jgi:hypothetical protein
MKQSDDQSLFAWQDESGKHTGLLADHPAGFYCSLVVPLEENAISKPFELSNKGIRLTVPL